MSIKEALEELKIKDNPVAKLMHAGVAFKVIVLAFKKGMVLREHKTNVKTKLTVLNGSVKYSSDTQIKNIDTYEEFEIPLDELHTIEAYQNSLCLLIQEYRN